MTDTNDTNNINGFTKFERCSSVQTWMQTLMGQNIVYDTCYAPVIKTKTIVEGYFPVRHIYTIGEFTTDETKCNLLTE